jgi:methyltransferase
LQFGFLGILFLGPIAPIIFTATWIPEATSIIYILATAILMFAAVALKPSLRISPIPADGAPLVTSGIYRWVSHPMYLSVLLYAGGMVLGNLSWITVTIWLSLLLTLVIKARFENILLYERHSGSPEYQDRFSSKGKK